MRNLIVRSVLVVTVVSLSSFALACRGGDRLDARTEEYQVVTEGSAHGVTDVVGPALSTPPMTGTSADTTTAFTVIAPNAATDSTALPPAPVYSAPPSFRQPDPSPYEPIQPAAVRPLTPRPAPPPVAKPAPPPQPEPPPTAAADEEEAEDVEDDDTEGEDEPAPETVPPTQTTTAPAGTPQMR